MFNNEEIIELRYILSDELKKINNYTLAEKVELLKDEEIKDILLKVFISNYKKENGLC